MRYKINQTLFYLIVLSLCLNVSCVFALSKQMASNTAISADENKIPAGKAITVDGNAEATEWDDAKVVSIEVEADWTVKVFFKQDANNLYFRFSNLKIADKKEFYPEVLIDTKNTKTKTWEKNQWWFHSSYSNIEGNGIFNQYKGYSKGKRKGWNGNNFPLQIGGDVEMSVSKSLISVKTDDTIGLAFDVTDTQKKWFYYPSNAKLESPETWATFKL